MRRIVMALMSTVTAVVLLFSYHTSTNSGSPGKVTAVSAGGDPASAANSGSGSGSGSGSVSYTGDEADTRWGVVQVEITVQDGRITKSDAVEYPTGNGRDQEINAYAVPALNAEVLQSQNAGIDAVSGATVTSDGYIQSLQSAIDQAGL